MTLKVRHPNKLGPHLRIVLGREVAVGPGKADLLEGIRDTGSIAAAGRRMGMSYKRAWYLVETMNACFRAPVVEAAKGGPGGGGARLTPLGDKVLAAYRRMQAKTAKAIVRELGALQAEMARRP